jgi:hypothetical protein
VEGRGAAFIPWLVATASVLLAACAGGARPEPICSGEPTGIPTADGPEDMVPVRLGDETYRLFVRVQNGIQTVALASDGALSTGSDPMSDILFDSLGLSLLEGEGSRPHELYAIDQGAHSVRRFAVRKGGLEPTGAVIAGPTHLPRPNDLLAVAREQGGEPDIYVSNPDLYWTRMREGAWPSVVLLRAGEAPRPVVQDLGFANGIAADPPGDHLLVADYRAKRLVAYRRDRAEGGLTPLCHVPMPALPDNLSVDIDDPDRVLVAAQDSLWLSGLHLLVSAKVPSPSRLLEVRFSELDLRGAGTDSLCGIRKGPDGSWPPLVWADGGAHVAAGSTAVQVGERLLISQIVRPGIHSFRCPRPPRSPGA